MNETVNLRPNDQIEMIPRDVIEDKPQIRFSGATWFDNIQMESVLLAGLGGIGSHVLFNLARLGLKHISVFDHDTVEYANLSGQLYSKADVGLSKVAAMSKFVNNYCDYNALSEHVMPYTSDCEATDIMICGFDNMDARRVFFTNWVNRVQKLHGDDKLGCLFIDGRMSANEIQIFAFYGCDNDKPIQRYAKEHLFKQSESEAALCSFKQTTYCATMMSSLITNVLVRFVENSMRKHPLNLPNFIYYNADTMTFKTELWQQ